MNTMIFGTQMKRINVLWTIGFIFFICSIDIISLTGKLVARRAFISIKKATEENRLPVGHQLCILAVKNQN
jgi:hypothetical protein